MKILVLLLQLISVLALPLVYAAEDKTAYSNVVRLTTTQWVDYTNLDGSGIYLEIIKAAFATQSIMAKFEFYPWKRAVYLAEYPKTSGANGVIGEYKLEKPSFYYPNWHIDVDYITAFYLKNNSKVQ